MSLDLIYRSIGEVGSKHSTERPSVDFDIISHTPLDGFKMLMKPFFDVHFLAPFFIRRIILNTSCSVLQKDPSLTQSRTFGFFVDAHTSSAIYSASGCFLSTSIVICLNSSKLSYAFISITANLDSNRSLSCRWLSQNK
jgi:hypothetical protein